MNLWKWKWWINEDENDELMKMKVINEDENDELMKMKVMN